MYKILLVDDENIFIEYFKSAIQWEQYGCTICGNAEDGPRAIKLIRKLQPHIVFMDIKMSSMSGLDVCDIVKDWDNAPHIIILTAYDEFNFAQKAIKLGVFDYLLKPFDKEELVSALHKCIENIKRSNEYEKLQQNNEKGKVEKYLTNMLEFGGEDIPEKVIKLEESTRFFAVLLKVKGDNDALITHIRNQLEIYLDGFGDIKSYIIGIHNGMISVIHFVQNSLTDIHGIRQRYTELVINNQNHMLKCDCVSVGSIVSQLNELHQSYQQAIIGIENRIKVKGNVIIFDDIINLEDSSAIYTANDVDILIKCFKNRQYEDADIVIEKIFALSENQMFNFQYVISVYYSLVISIYSYFNHKDYKMTDYLSIQTQMMKELNTCGTTQEVLSMIKNYIHEAFSDCMSFSNLNRGNIIVSKIEKYLDQHYKECDLTVSQIADALFFESSYIRRVYKTQTSKTITQRLEEIRINKAKELLRSTNYKHNQIANMVGYSDQFYFSRRFKLVSKLTPTEYQNLHLVKN